MDTIGIIKRLVKKYGTNCPFKLAEHLGVRIFYDDLGKVTRGFYFRKLRRSYIGIHNALPYENQRLVCAHELGHHFLHRGLGYYFIDQNTLFNPGKYEREANEFAVTLLLAKDSMQPDETFESYFKRNGIPSQMIAFYK
ncbi:ImmA/IrrE family metallo-endopeptidase [Paenibacillus sp. FSL M8-0228]|uniref:ImmA/IrrE family metallo-endopeptidase n=1 Tax=Paenibacillus sp. FSL M8-0228 TaxID=2921620 RepID=UPI0030F73029